MSLLFTSVEVLNGPTVGIKEQQVSLPVFNHGEYKETSLEIEQERETEDFVLLGMKSLNTYSFVTKKEEEEKQEAEDSSESSSIGVQSSSSEEEEDDDERGNEVQSKLKEEGALASLDSLEDSLPTKRGLSNFFTGKSKSFASLSEASSGSARELKKQENPFNKRKRILMANKISRSRRASYSSLITSLPSLLSPGHVVKEGEEEEDERGEEEISSFAPLPKPLSHGGSRGLSKTFKSPRSFSFSDLQHV
ncbi:hypothetical protein KFK09_006276 [Dendrobium nobile]|uniref:Uncharacterized protein n=1 Tax=Dendrobium nobile TaxID=94219 RepID=A0A8T3BQV4_DENNO|nr:hypothetical protein KFK09_006276 [Dendrobium nobile]